MGDISSMSTETSTRSVHVHVIKAKVPGRTELGSQVKQLWSTNGEGPVENFKKVW